MMWERRALQVAVGFASLVPISAGLAGVILGPGLVGGSGAVDADSHFRYLSGLLLGIGLAYAASIPRIERHRGRFLLLTLIVVAGGFARLTSVAALGLPSASMAAALAMELLVTPALAVWQARVARRSPSA